VGVTCQPNYGRNGISSPFPLTVLFGEEAYRDGDLTVDEFWEKAAGPHNPRPLKPPVGAYEEVYERLVRPWQAGVVRDAHR